MNQCHFVPTRLIDRISELLFGQLIDEEALLSRHTFGAESVEGFSIAMCESDSPPPQTPSCPGSGPPGSALLPVGRHNGQWKPELLPGG